MKRLLVVLLLIAATTSCGGGGQPSSSTTAAPSGITVSISPAAATVALGTSLQFIATVSGTSNSAVTWSLSGTSCASNACGIIDQSGLYSAPSSAPVPATANITAVSKADQTKSDTAPLVIGSGGPIIGGPTITTSALPSGTVGVTYSAVVIATGLAPFGWSISSGALPPGLSLSPISGQPQSIGITGTPTTAGTFDFTIRVSDDVVPPRSGTKDLRIVIN